MKILFIGNSYTYYNDMPEIFQNLANENGKNVQVFSVTCGGRKLIEYMSADEYTNALNSLIEEHFFDIVFLQEQSLLSITDYNAFHKGVSYLMNKIRPSAGEFILYETWGRKKGSVNLTELGLTDDEMPFMISNAYERLADETGAGLSHVGLNFYDIYKNHSKINLYDDDLSHPSYEGSCLSALTHYATVFGEFPENIGSAKLHADTAVAFKTVILNTYTGNINLFIEKNLKAMTALLKKLCHIPAPSGMEEKRAEYCKNWLEANGADGVYIDKAQNVIFPVNCSGSNEITVISAHTDTVFPDTEPMPYSEKNGRIYCPGVGDNTASLAVLMMTAKYFIKNSCLPPKGILFGCNSCEEGLGNLMGMKQIMKDFDGRIGRVIALDSTIGTIYDVCVGSHRYEVEVKCTGGHSFQKFGRKNAIHVLSEIISQIYKIRVPETKNTRTTYNVGKITGGTSVNTIAQSAKMLCEYRSDNAECLGIMEQKFNEIFKNAISEDAAITVSKVGDRPCANNINPKEQEALVQLCKNITESVSGEKVSLKSASTDCNIPLSMKIPAVCIGVYKGGGSHTREEYIEIASLRTGLEIAIKTAIKMGE